MRTDLSHLPQNKQRELVHVVDVIRGGFAKAIAHRTQERFRNGKILKIILFGSYARGDWVDDPVGRYFSDYDLLIVLSHEDLTDVSEFWTKTEDRLLDELSEGKALRTPVSLIYHSLDDVNEKLRLGRYFFIDILKEGILLFEEPGHPFIEPQELSPSEALDETRHSSKSGSRAHPISCNSAGDATGRGRNKLAAFIFIKRTERLYQCLFLVRTLYTPKTHNLKSASRSRRRDGAEFEAGLARFDARGEAGLCATERGLHQGAIFARISHHECRARVAWNAR